jgi:hypothetical protein
MGQLLDANSWGMAAPHSFDEPACERRLHAKTGPAMPFHRELLSLINYGCWARQVLLPFFDVAPVLLYRICA